MALGFLAGLVGTGGAIRGAMLTALGLAKEKYLATAAAIAIATDLARLPIYLSQGFLAPKYYVYIPMLLAVSFVGSSIGRGLVRRIPEHRFRRVVLVAIGLIGLEFIIGN